MSVGDFVVTLLSSGYFWIVLRCNTCLKAFCRDESRALEDPVFIDAYWRVGPEFELVRAQGMFLENTTSSLPPRSP